MKKLLYIVLMGGISLLSIPLKGKDIYNTQNNIIVLDKDNGLHFDKEKTLIVVLDVYGGLYFEKAVLTYYKGIIVAANSSLPSGIYFIIGSENHKLYRKKIILENDGKKHRD